MTEPNGNQFSSTVLMPGVQTAPPLSWTSPSFQFSTATVPTPSPTDRAYFGIDQSDGGRIRRNDDGSMTVLDIPIFRSGEFRDSRGRKMKWTQEHLEQMVSNFRLLRQKRIFPNVPVRADHSFSAEKVMGYFEDVRVDGDLLRADLLVTEPDHGSRIERRTYRSVSLEVGTYTTNDDETYWPTVMGLAYVDIPAVEGLHSKEISVAYFSHHKENTTVTTNDDRGATKPQTFRINGVETADFAQIQSYITELEKRPAALATFRVNGADVQEPALVQTHIDNLEKFVSDSRDASRKEFVAALAKDNKITAPQVEHFEKLALEMSDEQFAVFQAGFASAPANSLLGEHGKGQGEGDGAPASGEAPSALTIAKEQVDMFRRQGMSDDEIKNTSAFKRLTELSKGA